MKHRTLAFLLFLIVVVSSGVYAQPAAEIVASAVDSCTTGMNLIVPADRFNRVYMLGVCDRKIRLICYDTNLVWRWFGSDQQLVSGVMDAAVDSRGNLLVAAYETASEITLFKFELDGRVAWRRRHFARNRAIHSPAITIGEQDNVFLSYLLTGESAVGARLFVEELSSEGDSLRNVAYPSDSTIIAKATFLRPDNELRIVTSRVIDLQAFIEDAVLETSGNVRILGTHRVSQPGVFYPGHVTIDGAGTATIPLQQHDDSIRFQVVRSSENGTMERVDMMALTIDRTVYDFRSDRRGGTHFLWTIMDERSTGQPILRRISADGTEQWRRTSGSVDSAPDSLSAMMTAYTLNVGDETESYLAGLRPGEFVVQRIDSLGNRRWAVATPWLFSSSLAPRPLVKQMVVDVSGATYALLHEYPETILPVYSRILRIAAPRPASIGTETLADARRSFFSADPAALPNPVSDVVSVRFSLERSADVTIELFTTAGEKISTLASVRGESGENLQEFSLRNAGVSSGAYLVAITAGGSGESSRFVWFGEGSRVRLGEGAKKRGEREKRANVGDFLQLS